MNTHEGTGCGCSFPDGPHCAVYLALERERNDARLDLWDAQDELKKARGKAARLLAQQKLARARQNFEEAQRRKHEHRAAASGPVPIPGGIA